MQIRPERDGDQEAIRFLVAAAFGQEDEARLVDQLRADGDAAISLVAERDGEIVGHVLFSPMGAPFRALGLAPVAVAPDFQKQGIGAALIEQGLNLARNAGWEAVFVLGDPNYYTRFGFSVAAAEGFANPYSGPYFMALELKSGALKPPADVSYAPAFS